MALNLFPWLRGNGAQRRNGLPPLPDLGADGPKTLMAIMAHPDDIDFGSAGSVARWCSEGWTVYYVLATSGDKGTHDPAFTPQELAATRDLVGQASGRAQARIAAIRRLALQAGELADMEYGFLYDKPSRLLSIGYNVDERRFDSSYYDLLASEARMASLVAIGNSERLR